MFKTIAIVIVVVLALILGYAAVRPDNFRVQRSATIKAPPEKIFALIDDFHAWGSWSPFEKLDPGMKRTFSGAASGKGAAYAWDSSGKAGAGSMEIQESTPSSRILIKLDFTKPLEGHNTAEFTIDTQGDSSKVTWAMYGPSPYVAKVMGIFFSMDSMIGKDFESGLANLKNAAEK
ncbi:polyketide cyclase/dehydrase/lipid transport protein [Collimonas sp. PA-H2]|uniref:SRPBCC family protein n=1 Tax=Collimonas sp. PA-H2 TaxID=1881062 RepID=UPI000BF6C3BE|nr:SRPBCC family protein [Collimonas sp. PA-H2]PFH08449.1 polyketide cyclase/dehydrase/lipid transport protein [Collimonas sp. PA-H2]